MRFYAFESIYAFYAFYALCSIFRNRGPAFTKMVRPATRPANTGCLPDPHGDGGPPPEAAYGYVRQYVRIYERTAEHKRNRTQQAPHDEHGLRSIGDTVPNKHPTRDFLRPDYYSSVL